MKVIIANIYGQEVKGVVKGEGIHKGKRVIDFEDKDGNERFCYEYQVVSIY